MILPNLRIYLYVPEDFEILKFLENNEKHLTDLYLDHSGVKSSNLSIIRYCPNLKKNILVFNVDIWCGERFVYEEEMLDNVINYSPKKFLLD